MERMTDFLLNAISPDGSASAFGDGDDSRALWTHACCPSDYRALLSLGAALFRRGDFKALAGGLAEEVLWLLGNAGICEFQKLPAHLPAHTSAAYHRAGYYVLRSGWDKSDSQLIFNCGSISQGTAGHGHADALSFCLYANGYGFVVDSGTFSYNLDYDWRDAFRSTRAHNTVVVDAVDQSVPADRMSWKSLAASRCLKWVTNPWFSLVAGEHDGYERLPDPVMHRRAVAFLTPDTWLIFDQLDASAVHSLEMFLHLQPDCSIDVHARDTRVVLRSPDGATLNAWVLDAAGNFCLPEVLTGSDDERSAWFSPAYGTRVPTNALKIRREFERQTTVFTCLSTCAADFQPIIDQGALIGVSIRRGKETHETLFYRFHRDWPAGAEGIHFDGKLLFRRAAEGSGMVLSAGDFRLLSVVGLLDVRSPVSVDSLNFNDSLCEIVVANEHASGIQIRARDGVRLLINGQATPIGQLAP